MTDDADALVPLVRNAGAVFVGPWAPAAVGDYVAGRQPRAPHRAHRAVRQRAARRHFRKHMHVVRVTRRGSRRRRRARRGARRRPRVSTRTAGASRCAASAAFVEDAPMSVPALVAPRDDLARARGLPLAAARRRRCGSTRTRARTRRPPSSSTRGSPRCATAPLNRYPDRAARELRAALGASARAAAGAAVLRERLERGAADAAAHLRRTGSARARVRADVRAARAHRPHHRHRGGGRGAARRLHDRSRRRARARRRAAARRSCSCAARTTRPAPSRRRAPSRRCSTRTDGLVVVDEAYGEFAPRSALELVRDDGRLVVVRTYSKVWSMAALRLGFAVAPPWVVEQLEKVVLPYHLAVATQIAGTIALELRRRDGRRGSRAWSRSGSAWSRALDELDRVTVFPSGANFLLFRVHGDGHALWQALVERGVLVRDFSRWPRLEDCLRVTVGTPEENDAFLAALREAVRGGGAPDGEIVTAAPRHEGDDDRSRPRGRRRRERVGVDRHPVLRPHARAARQARRLRPARSRPPATSRSTCTTPSKTSASCSAPRSRRRSATRPACAGSPPRSSRSTRRSCRSRSTSRAGRSSSTRSTRSSEWIGTFDPQLAEEFWRALRVRGAGITLHLRSLAGANGHHVIEASFKGVARALRDAVQIEGTGVPSTKGTLERRRSSSTRRSTSATGRCVRLLPG